MKLSTARKEADFYIARVGSKAGQPMWDNYTSNNAFSVDSNRPKHDFQLALHLYRSGKLGAYTIGTCQASIRKRDIMRLLNDHKVSLPTLKKMAAVDALIQVKELELNKLKELQTAISRST
tara:strand:+ start:1342 stop:1704 length:363 start_codon:yes stop_codon:yes gene_type:complete